MTTSNQFQQARIELADGRELVYNGPAQVSSAEMAKGKVIVRRVSITEPVDLPDGCSFEDLPNGTNPTNPPTNIVPPAVQ